MVDMARELMATLRRDWCADWTKRLLRGCRCPPSKCAAEAELIINQLEESALG